MSSSSGLKQIETERTESEYNKLQLDHFLMERMSASSKEQLTEFSSVISDPKIATAPFAGGWTGDRHEWSCQLGSWYLNLDPFHPCLITFVPSPHGPTVIYHILGEGLGGLGFLPQSCPPLSALLTPLNYNCMIDTQGFRGKFDTNFN